MRTHVKVFRLYSESLLDLKLVRWIVHGEVEVLQKHRHDQESFLPRKWSTNATSHAVTERLPAVREFLFTAIELLIEHPFGSEFFCVFSIYSRIPMDLGEKYKKRRVSLDRILAANDGVLLRSDSYRGCCG